MIALHWTHEPLPPLAYRSQVAMPFPGKSAAAMALKYLTVQQQELRTYDSLCCKPSNAGGDAGAK